MEKDLDYTALVQIERSMKNEISAFSMSSNRLLEYLASLKGSTLSANAVLKAMTMLAKMDTSQRNPKSAKALRYWMNAIIEAWGSPLKGMLYESIDFDGILYPEFEPDKRLQKSFARYPSRMGWMVALSSGLFLGLLVALFVLVFKWNFWACFWIGLLAYGLFVAYYFLWLDRRIEIYRLKRMTFKMSPATQRFVRSLPVTNLPLFPNRYDLMDMYEAWKEGAARRKIAKEKAALAQAHAKALKQAQSMESQRFEPADRFEAISANKARTKGALAKSRKKASKPVSVARTRSGAHYQQRQAAASSMDSADGSDMMIQTGSMSAQERKELLDRVEANAKAKNAARRQAAKSRFDISIDDEPSSTIDLSVFEFVSPGSEKPNNKA